MVATTVCTDSWYLVLNFCDTRTLVQMSNVNHFFQEAIFENKIQKKWNVKHLRKLFKHQNIALSNRVTNTNQTRFSCDSFFVYCFCTFGSLEIIRSFFNDSKPITNDLVNLAFLHAIKSNRLEVFRYLLFEKKFDPSVNDNKAIRIACKYGNTEIVSLLLQDPRVDPSVKNDTPICHACVNGHSDIVSLLMKTMRVDPIVNHDTPIQLASGYGHLNVVKVLVQEYTVDTSVGIKEAVKYGHLNVVEFLLQRNDSRVTDAFEIAIKYGHLFIVKFLIENYQVDCTVGLEKAIDYNRLEIADLLLQRDIKILNNLKITFNLYKHGNLEMIKLLLNDKTIGPLLNKKEILLSMWYKEYWHVIEFLISNEKVGIFGYGSLTLEELKTLKWMVNKMNALGGPKRTGLHKEFKPLEKKKQKQ